MLGKIRPFTKRFTRIIAKPIAATGINPNMFSFLGVILALVAAYFIVQKQFPESFIFAVLAVSIDLFDGAVAQLQGKKSLFGNYFETMIDKIVEIILFIAASFIHPIAAICALGFSMLAAYAKPRVALVIITDNRDWPAIGEHSERMLIFIFGLLLLNFTPFIFGYSVLELSLWAIAIISFVGAIQRIFYAKKLIAEAEQNGTVLPYLKK